jgi:exonuclease III
MIRQRVNILCVQETKWKGQKAKKVEDTGFKLWCTGTTSTKNDVGIVLDKRLKDGVVDIKRQGDKIILVKLLIADLVSNVISAYVAPQIGLDESVKMQFWEELDALVSSVPVSEKLFIGDLNGHVDSIRIDFDGVHGGFRYE